MTSEKALGLGEVEKQVCRCEGCPLAKTRTNTVFSRGSGTKVMFIGEAPGEQEDAQGKPFVGKAGQLLDLYIDFIGLEEKDYYITNILKCRPPHNRDPLPEEEEACMGYLKEQVRLLQPQVIVCLGRIAASRIISPDFRITKDHGTRFRRGNTVILATFHPSALLRDPSKREAALDDFKKILEELKEA
jgi:DNA polymerase